MTVMTVLCVCVLFTQVIPFTLCFLTQYIWEDWMELDIHCEGIFLVILYRKETIWKTKDNIKMYPSYDGVIVSE